MPPPSGKAGHVGSLSGHAARITALRTLSWSSGPAKPPRGTSWSPPSLRRSTASKGRFLIPLVVREQAQLSHPYTSNTKGRASPPRGVWDRVPVPVPGPGFLCPPRRLPLRPLCLRRRRRAPPPRRRGSGHPRWVRPRRGGGWLVLGSGGLGGDEVSGVGVDVVEVGVVVVVVVGVVRRHLLDAGGDAPHRLHVRFRGRPAPRPPPFAPPSPRGPRAPSCLSPGAHSALALALGSLPSPHAFIPLSAPWLPPLVTCALACTAGARILPVPVSMPLAAPALADRAPLHSMRSVAARLGALLAPLRVLPVPLPFPRSLSRVVPSAASALSPSAAAGLGTLPNLRPCSLPRAPGPAPCVCPWALPLSPPVPRSALPWPAPCPAGALSPPSRITRRASCCRRICRSVTPGGVRSGAGGRMGCGCPVGKEALGGYGLGGLVWVCLGLAWARYLASSLPSAAAAAAPGEAVRARAGSVPRACGVLGAAAWPARAPARLARAAVSAPCALSPPSSVAAAPPGEAPWARAAPPPPRRRQRAGGSGRGRSAACWGCGLSPLCPWGPLRGRGARARSLGSGGGLLSLRWFPG